jgi:hypothetical protein
VPPAPAPTFLGGGQRPIAKKAWPACLNKKIIELQQDDTNVRDEYDPKIAALQKAVGDLQTALDQLKTDVEGLKKALIDVKDPPSRKACAFAFARYKGGTANDPNDAVGDALSATLVAVTSSWTIQDCRTLAKNLNDQTGVTIRAFRPACIFLDPAKASLGSGIPDPIGGAFQPNWWPLSVSKPFNPQFTPSPNCGW